MRLCEIALPNVSLVEIGRKSQTFLRRLLHSSHRLLEPGTSPPAMIALYSVNKETQRLLIKAAVRSNAAYSESLVLETYDAHVSADAGWTHTLYRPVRNW